MSSRLVKTIVDSDGDDEDVVTTSCGAGGGVGFLTRPVVNGVGEGICRVCRLPTLLRSSRLLCEACGLAVHVACLQSPFALPTTLMGDTFFSLTSCSGCPAKGSSNVIKRDKINWLSALTLAIYNLKHSNPEGAREGGFFHWKMHIAKFLEDNWISLFGLQMKKRRTWLGTISGTLSHWSGAVFCSGSTVLKECGWWKLVRDQPPADLIASIPSVVNGRQSSTIASNNKSRHLLEPIDGENDHQKLQPQPASADKGGQGPPEQKRTRGVRSNIQTAMALKEKRATLSEAKELRRKQPSSRPVEVGLNKTVENLVPESGRKTVVELLGKLEEEPVGTASPGPPFTSDLFHEDNLTTCIGFCWSRPIVELGAPPSPDPEVDELIISSKCKLPSLPNVEDLVSGISRVNHSTTSAAACSSNAANPSKKPFFDPNLANGLPCPQQCYKSWPGSIIRATSSSRGVTTSTSDDSEPLNTFNGSNPSSSPPVSSLETWSSIRKDAKTTTDLQGSGDLKKPSFTSTQFSLDILDRFQARRCSDDDDPSMSNAFVRMMPGSSSFRSKLTGKEHVHDLCCFKSPYTGRMLKPYIRRDFKSEPLKLRLMRELLRKTNPGGEDPAATKKHPIDFMYIQPQHILPINNLANQFFWPGIEVSECLQYPDFSCVATYRKVVVGFAFAVPDVSHLEAYLPFMFTHPEWRRAGIAKFMLYHLIQACMGRDITLHVPVDSPGVFLSQKFGFKMEQVALAFYEKYLPPTSSSSSSFRCKNALLFRLSR